MICEHLQPLEKALQDAGIPEVYRGRPWSMNCREWVYFDCYLDLEALRIKYALPAWVTDHIHRGTHDGQERGLVCSQCHDAIMGLYEPVAGKPTFGT